MPVADEGQDQDYSRDHKQASRFQGIDLRRAVVLRGSVFGWLWFRLPFLTGRGHGIIVAPQGDGVLPKNLARLTSMEPR
jgi:hypothetical protein